MKLGEMAEMLHGLAASLERFLGKAALNDLRDMAECLRQYPEETVASFCNLVVKAAAERAPIRRRPPAMNEEKIVALVGKISYFRENHADFDYSHIKDLVKEVGKLTVPHVKAIGDRSGCPLTGTKANMLANLENWLANLKRTAEQSSFSLAHPGM